MELEREQMIMAAVGGLLILIAIWWFFFKNKKSGGDAATASVKADSVEKPTIYGSLGCPYTVKQIEKYKDHEFVDCSSGGCPSFVTAYPTTKWPNGKIEVGFS
jgi:LPXTG-motif cell wall-anchored protein